jgi:hypothetical protein
MLYSPNLRATGSGPPLENFRRPEFDIGSFHIISQQPDIVSEAAFRTSISQYLPQFIQFWKDLEQATGFRWKCTSYLRDSPTHKKGQAMDFAPDWDPKDAHKYSANQGSDPVLYKRQWLFQRLKLLRRNNYGRGNNHMGIFIEPDHLHVQVLKVSPHHFPTSVVKWQVAKPVYPDTYRRMQLPIFNK